jgi:hypothetical protein
LSYSDADLKNGFVARIVLCCRGRDRRTEFFQGVAKFMESRGWDFGKKQNAVFVG